VRLLTALLAALCLARGARAQSAGADFLRAEIPARPAALAGAFGAFHDDATGFLWNPSALGHVKEPALSASHFSSIVDTSFDEAAFVVPAGFKKTPAGLGLAVQYSATAGLQETDLQGNDKGAIDNHDFVLQAGYGLLLGKRLAFGLGAKIFSSQLAEFRSRGAALDLGVQSKVMDRLDLGISFVDWGTQEAYDSQPDPLPTRLRLALKALAVDAPDAQVLAALEVDRPWTTSDPILVTTGAEYWYQKVMAFRVGWRFGADTGNLTLGTGVKWSGLSFDYAYVAVGDVGITHRFTLAAELGKAFEKVAGDLRAPPPPHP
jgi:hypothetical protein